MADIEIERGMIQALFKFLPGEWIDFYSGRVVAKVRHWDSRPLEGINKMRLLKRVENSVKSFKSLKGISQSLSPEDYEVMRPKRIQVSLDPLTFFCKGCGRAHSFKSAEQMRSKLKECKCQCGGRLQQLELVYACECGWAGPVAPQPCPNKEHGFSHITYKPGDRASGRAWVCNKCGHQSQVLRLCPECKAKLFPTPFRQHDVYIPRTLTMIDLIESSVEKYLEDPRAAKLINAYWLGNIDEAALQKLIEKGIESPEGEEETAAELKEKISVLISAGLSREQAERAAEALLASEGRGGRVAEEVRRLESVYYDTEEAYYHSAIAVLEHDAVLRSGRSATLEFAMKKAKILSSSSNPEAFLSAAEAFGFSDARACSGVPIIFCSYGYSRKQYEPSQATLRGFEGDKELEGTGKKPIYAAKLETEGVLFEVDRRKIIEWLLKNELVDEKADNLPDDLDDDAAVKAWFLKNVRASEAKRYSEIDPSERITKHVYTLVHSMSHILLKSASGLCGLDKDSLSEYIFPSIPAFLIYCHSAQGYNLGALFNLFEAFFDKWLYSALESAENCIYDPICLDDKGACIGCLYINEISCQHFNKDLDRKYLIGRVDEAGRFWGFWEGS